MDAEELVKLKLVHEIHTSGRRSFRACRRRWDWLFRQAYYPKTTAKPLEFGVAYHEAMEVFYNPDTWTWDVEIRAQLAIKTFVDKCNEQYHAALADTGNYEFEEDVETDYKERVELGRGMLAYYFAEVSPKLDVGWKPVKVEVGFFVLIPNPETRERVIWCKCDDCYLKMEKYYDSQSLIIEWQSGRIDKDWQGLPVVYAGRLDMLAEDMNGNYWIFDWKTARSVTESGDDSFLYLDDQVGSYVWALRKVGFPIMGFVYHEQRKGYPQPPKENKARRLGCLFSVAKNQDVDYETYLETIRSKDLEAYESGSYDVMLKYLQEEGTKYYGRHQIAKSANEIMSIEEAIGQEALDMIDPGLRIYPSPGRFGCNYCAFRQPCMEKNSKGDYQYALDTLFERREHYYVRKEASTESKGGE